jgi:hypothetical protein
MAGIWTDVAGAHNNISVSNVNEVWRFRWIYATFSGEEQEKAQIRWRKAGLSNLPTPLERISGGSDSQWSTPYDIGRLEDTTTWTLVGGQLTPPASGRRYSNIVYIDFPLNTFTSGTYFFQVRQWTVGATEWSDWSSHAVEFVDYRAYQDFDGAGTSALVDPAFPNEGNYAYRVEVMSAAGVTSESTNSAVFKVWDTNRYIHDGTNVKAIPEHFNDGTVVRRTRRTV